jgi:hypothetical protein
LTAAQEEYMCIEEEREKRMNEFVYTGIVRDGWRERKRKSKTKVPTCVEFNSSLIIISC